MSDSLIWRFIRHATILIWFQSSKLDPHYNPLKIPGFFKGQRLLNGSRVGFSHNIRIKDIQLPPGPEDNRRDVLDANGQG